MFLKKFSFALTLIITLGLSQALIAQDKESKPKYGWTREAVGTLNLSQTTLSNWVQGGENTFAWQADFRASFVNNQPRSAWRNNAKLSYGMSKIADAEARKSVDEIRVESVYVRKLGIFVDPYAAVRAETQMTTGYDYSGEGRRPVSAFLDPGYFVESLGVGFQPWSFLKTRFGAALKQTVADKYRQLYTDDPATPTLERVRSEVGAESVTDVNKKLGEKTVYTAKLELFSNLKGIRQVDVRWDNLLSAKVSELISVNFNFKLFYDSDVSKKRQIRQTLMVGLSYAFL
ncbi:MAG: DUF3078 domain-containing protein [Calditrichaeota bacterium]|nr:DUF3078 domain-containing protein [Calditrichota bacterium]